MGTNYYWRPIMTEEQREKILNKVERADSVEEIKNYISERFPDTEVHIGKQSAGWQFLFWLGIEKYTKLTYDDIKDWLSSGCIYDEYGNLIFTCDFLRIVLKNSSGFTYSEYYAEFPEEPIWNRGSDQIINDLRFTTDDREFC